MSCRESMLCTFKSNPFNYAAFGQRDIASPCELHARRFFKFSDVRISLNFSNLAAFRARQTGWEKSCPIVSYRGPFHNALFASSKYPYGNLLHPACSNRALLTRHRNKSLIPKSMSGLIAVHLCNFKNRSFCYLRVNYGVTNAIGINPDPHHLLLNGEGVYALCGSGSVAWPDGFSGTTPATPATDG